MVVGIGTHSIEIVIRSRDLHPGRSQDVTKTIRQRPVFGRFLLFCWHRLPDSALSRVTFRFFGNLNGCLCCY